MKFLLADLFGNEKRGKFLFQEIASNYVPPKPEKTAEKTSLPIRLEEVNSVIQTGEIVEGLDLALTDVLETDSRASNYVPPKLNLGTQAEAPQNTILAVSQEAFSGEHTANVGKTTAVTLGASVPFVAPKGAGLSAGVSQNLGKKNQVNVYGQAMYDRQSNQSSGQVGVKFRF